MDALRQAAPALPLVRCTAIEPAGGEAVITHEAGVVTIAGTFDGAALRQAVKMAAGRSEAPPARPDNDVDEEEGNPQP